MHWIICGVAFRKVELSEFEPEREQRQNKHKTQTKKIHSVRQTDACRVAPGSGVRGDIMTKIDFSQENAVPFDP